MVIIHTGILRFLGGGEASMGLVKHRTEISRQRTGMGWDGFDEVRGAGKSRV